MVVVSPEGNEYREVAAELASRRDEPVVDSFGSVEPEETVIYVSPPAIDEAVLLRLQRRFLQHGPD